MLLCVHSYSYLRWGSRPTELQRGAVLTYRINLNTADRVELLQVPGVGNSLARQIEDYRRRHGFFHSVNDLTQVGGIGPTTLERLRPWVCVSSAEEERDAESQATVTKRPPPRGKTAGASSEDCGDRKSTSQKEATLSKPIDINQASVLELQRLPGIGPKRAQLIVEQRQKALFKSADELRRVQGIGPKTLERLRPYVTVGSAPERVVSAD